jgi:hypothetical protein
MSGEGKMAEVVKCASGYFVQAGKYKGAIYDSDIIPQQEANNLNTAADAFARAKVREFAEKVIDEWKLGLTGRDSIRKLAEEAS